MKTTQETALKRLRTASLDSHIWLLDVPLNSHLQTIRRYHTFEGFVGGRFRHCVPRVTVSFNPLDLSQFSTLVRLMKGHNIDHKPLLFGGSELDEAFVEGEAVSTHNNGKVSNPELLADQGV